MGCVISFFVKEPSPRFISLIMGFSAGVMILISFVELLQEGIKTMGLFTGLLFFFVGMFIMLIIDVLISHRYEFETLHILYDENFNNHNNSSKNSDGKNSNPHHSDHHKHRHGHYRYQDKLEKTSLLVFLGIFIHNIPEGIATFVATVSRVELGILLAIAIALHNIPEGIAVSVPIYASTKNRRKAFFWSFLSGISEFIGAVVVGLFFYPFIDEFSLGAMLAIVAGLMVYISLDELLPVAHSLGKEHMAILGIMLGMIVMTLSLILIS
ncbi:MAG: zinc transporter ZupT [Promethearchaeota archaeon]